MKILPIIFLVFSYPFFAFAQHHEIKIGIVGLNDYQQNYNLGYEYLFSEKIGLQLQTGYSKESSSSII